MEIKIIRQCFDGYAISVNGEILMECLTLNELRQVTTGDVIEMYCRTH